MNTNEIAKNAVESLSGRNDHTAIAGTTIVVGIDGDDTYWVADNGEESISLTKEQAIEIVSSNLNDAE